MTGGERAAGDASRALADALAAQRLRIVASLIRTTGDWDLAEDAVADATERALRHWPVEGVPDNPAAWLTTTARRRALDVLRRARNERVKLAEAAAQAELATAVPEDRPAVPAWEDDRLRLLFTCCHPALPLEGRVALTCKVVAGLSTATLARAFLVPEATMGPRLLRAKQKIAHAGIPYRVPAPEQVEERLDGVLAVVYLVFTTGWAAADDDSLATEAIRLGRLLVELVPRSQEVRGLLALMLLQHARRPARLVDGELVRLEHQDRGLWDRELTEEGLAILRSADGRGPYRLQAELAAVHARARTAGDTDWAAVVRLYDELLDVHPSPVVSLNRAVALGMAQGPEAGLRALDELTGQRVLAGHHLLPAVRADLLARAGRCADAVRALDQAIRLAPTAQERRALTRRRDGLEAGTEGDPGGGALSR